MIDIQPDLGLQCCNLISKGIEQCFQACVFKKCCKKYKKGKRCRSCPNKKK